MRDKETKATGIQDFGQKIGGARKDVWAGRGLDLGDLENMNEAEQTAYVTKDNVWPKPDWETLIASGADKTVCFWQNEVRKTLPKDAKRVIGDNANARYVSFVRNVMERIMSVTSLANNSAAFQFVRDNGFVEKTGFMHYRITTAGSGLVTTTFFAAIQITSELALKRKKSYALFGVPKQDAAYVTAKRDLEIFQYDGKQTHFVTEMRERERTHLEVKHGFATHFFYPERAKEYEKTWVTGSWFIVSMSTREILAYNIETKEAASSKVEEFARQAKLPEKKSATRKAKTNFKYPQLAGIIRTGKDVRNGQDVTPELLMETFGFRGGEFGNWLGDKERQENLNYAYDAFYDLADALGINPKCISFHDVLSIAFGARGKGGASAAMAHYEPLRKVINLTRMKGAGCLAHEWAHALDHELADSWSQPGPSDFASERTASSDAPTSWKELLKAMQRKENGMLTDFYVASNKFDQIHKKGGHGYWSSTCEMFARSFDCYLTDKLKEKGIRSDYLTAHSDCFTLEIDKIVYRAYPVGEERKRLNECFDTFFEDLKNRQILARA